MIHTIGSKFIQKREGEKDTRYGENQKLNMNANCCIVTSENEKYRSHTQHDPHNQATQTHTAIFYGSARTQWQ